MAPVSHLAPDLTLLTLAANRRGRARRVVHQGREFLVAPVRMLPHAGVLNGSRGPGYYPPEENGKDPGAWNGMPLVLWHPKRGGVHVSARSPEVLEEFGVGHVYNASFGEGGLRAEAWFDVEATARAEARHRVPGLLEKIEQGEAVELSTGLFTDNEPALNGSSHRGRAYTWVARNHRPDHLAILPDQPGACSVKDGCGVNVNAGGHNNNPEGCNQHTGPGCSRGKRAARAQEVIAKAKAERKAIFEELKGEAEEALGKADAAIEQISKRGINWIAADTQGNSGDDDHVEFGEFLNSLEERVASLDDMTPGEKFAELKNIETEAKNALKVAKRLKPLFEEDETGKPFESIAQGDLDENRKALGAIVEESRKARGHLKDYAETRKEMRAIKNREEYTGNASDEYLALLLNEDLSWADDPTPPDANAHKPSASLDMTPEKACKILKDGAVHGHPLTTKQRGMFGALCGKRGKKPTANLGTLVVNMNNNPKGCNQFTGPGCSTGGGAGNNDADLKAMEGGTLKSQRAAAASRKAMGKHSTDAHREAGKLHGEAAASPKVSPDLAAKHRNMAAFHNSKAHAGPGFRANQANVPTLNALSHPQRTGADMTRAEHVAYLTANCACQKGKEAVLNNPAHYTDEELAAMVENDRRHKALEPVGNAFVEMGRALGATEATPIEEAVALVRNRVDAACKMKGKGAKKGPPMVEDEEEEEETTMNAEQVQKLIADAIPKAVPAYLKTLSVNEYLEMSPPEMRAMVTNALAVETAERKKLADAILANMAFPDDAARARYAAWLGPKPLDELQMIAAPVFAANAAAREARQHSQGIVLNPNLYDGAQGGAAPVPGLSLNGGLSGFNHPVANAGGGATLATPFGTPIPDMSMKQSDWEEAVLNRAKAG